MAWRFRLLILLAFFGQIAILTYFLGKYQLAIEMATLGIFACLGTLSGTFEYAKDWLSRASHGGSLERFNPLLQLRLIPVWLFAGLAMAGGGGGLRNLAEISVARAFEMADHALKFCYTLTIFWPPSYEGWMAVFFGAVFGTLTSIITTYDVSTSDVHSQESNLHQSLHFLDFTACGFFAGYGIEAAIKFTSSLPFSTATQFVFLLICGLLATLSGMLTSFGGGLMKNWLVDVLLLRPGNMRRTLCNWVTKIHLWVIGAIAFLGFVFHQILDRTPLQFGTCAYPTETNKFITELFCGAVALFAILGTSPPPQTEVTC
jgi:hypothetical protein